MESNMSELFCCFKENIKKNEYYQGKWSIFKNTGKSDGQPDHCDYPRAHDHSETIESPANES